MAKLSPRKLTAIAMLLGVASASPAVFAQSSVLNVPDPKSLTTGPVKPATVKGDFTLVSVGDLLISAPVSDLNDPELKRALALVKKGDVAIGNQEGLFFDLKGFNGSADNRSVLRGSPALAKDEKAFGIDMVSTANNHSTDWGREGLFAETHLLDEAGIVHAGDGRNLTEARAGKFFNTPKGKVALIATTSTMNSSDSMALDAVEGVPARAGVSGLRLRTTQIVTQDTFDKIRAAGGRGNGDRLSFGGQTFRVGAKPGTSYEMNTYDHYGILKAIREAKAQADLAVFTIHAHQNSDGMGDNAMGEPGDFLVELFHDAVDAGADVVMGGGPHSLRGIEIYKGKPIFYGLGVFFITGDIYLSQEGQTEVYGPVPKAPVNAPTATARPGGVNPASWYDGFLATTSYRNGKVSEVRLYPLDLGQKGGPDRKGLPYLASPERAKGILEELQKASTEYGTKIALEGSVGVIRP